MTEHTIDTFENLLNKYEVVIPVIQRDYAQGRQDVHTQRVRSNLLSAIKDAITGITPTLDLNFIYGKVDIEKFIPVDGQQRLTTLFLLYLYAYSDDESKTALLHKFTYETRKSSRDFFEKLVEKRSTLFHVEHPPSLEIQDAEWFVTSWQFDPTVQSILVMLDAIKENFGDVGDLSERLNSSPAPLTFQFLEMNNLGMEDSLYIKLNARGKPLSTFENLKAELISRAEKIKYPHLKEMEKKFDGDWTDLFWSTFNSKFDESFLSFFGVTFMNHSIIKNDSKDWLAEVKFDDVTPELFDTIYYSLEYLSKHPNSLAFELIKNTVSSNPTYPNRILMHAVTTFLFYSKGEKTDNFDNWLRIKKNLTLNSRIDEFDLYRRAIDGINTISSEWNSLLSYFAAEGKISGFSLEQVREEQIKAMFINNNEDYLNVFVDAEKHPYFKGEIRSALYYAGFYDSNGDIELFQEYWNKISELFDENKPKHGVLLRQALLTFGDYRLPIKKYKTLCSDNPEESQRNPSIKRLFSDHGPIVKNLLDTLNFHETFEAQLKKIISSAKLPKTDWRYCFVNYPELLDWMNLQFLRTRDVDGITIMVPNKESTGKNNEVFASALHIALKEYDIPSYTNVDSGYSQKRYLIVDNLNASFKDRSFTVTNNMDNKVIFKSTSDDPIDETVKFIHSIYKK